MAHLLWTALVGVAGELILVSGTPLYFVLLRYVAHVVSWSVGSRLFAHCRRANSGNWL